MRYWITLSFNTALPSELPQDSVHKSLQELNEISCRIVHKPMVIVIGVWYDNMS